MVQPKPGLEEVRSRIEARFADMTTRIQQAARYVIDNPDDVALFSMRNVAQRADVSPATMIRLTKELGYKSYNDFRILFQNWLQTRHFSFADRADQVRRSNKGSDVSQTIAEIVEKEALAIRATLDQTDPERLAEAAQHLKVATKIYVCGLRTAYLPAYYFHYASRLHSDKTILLEGPGGSFADELRFIRPKDALLAFVSKPYARATMKAIEYAAEQKCRVIVVTDSIFSPAGREATTSIIAQGMGPSHFPMIGPTMIVAEVLLSLMLVNAEGDFLSAIHRTEHQLRSFEVSLEVESDADENR